MPADDVSECEAVALWLALRDHDSEHPSGQKFTTTLYRFVIWECRRRLRLLNREKRLRQIKHERLKSYPDERYGLVFESLVYLDEEDRDILQMYFFQKYTLQDIAMIKNRSSECCRKKIKRAIENLRGVIVNS